MDNVVDLFTGDSGYFIDDDKVHGVYHMGLQCVESEGVAVIRDKSDPFMKNQVEMSVEDMNRFCIMWLCIYNPESISSNGDENGN